MEITRTGNTGLCRLTMDLKSSVELSGSVHTEEVGVRAMATRIHTLTDYPAFETAGQ